ncbi:MAG: TRL-like family protein [Verrucomicrobiia bacterium]|jgi:hypothetical protein
MKKLSISVLLSSIAVMLLTGCTAVGPSYGGNTPVAGWAYTDTQAPSMGLAVPIDPTAQRAKVGESSASGILGIVGVGDASVEAAMKNGGITKIHHVDHKVYSILCLYVKYTTVVYGE